VAEILRREPICSINVLALRLVPQEIVRWDAPVGLSPTLFFTPRTTTIPTYGVIELKRPDSKIIAVTRSNVAVLTRDAETAIEQANMYAHRARRSSS